MYGKIFESMYDGTLRTCWQALVTFQQMIVLCDCEGVVDMTPHAIAGRTGIPLDIIEPGINHLEAPDPYSRSPECEGRRLERLDSHRPWGWRIVNYRKYRDLITAEEKRAADRIRIAAKRALDRDVSQSVADSREPSHSVANVAYVEVEVEVEASTPTPARAGEAGDDGPGTSLAPPIHDWHRIPRVDEAAMRTWLEYLAQAHKRISPATEVSMAKAMAATGDAEHQRSLIALHVERGWRNIRNVDLEAELQSLRGQGGVGGKRLTKYERMMEEMARG